jgi:hypothetical protein
MKQLAYHVRWLRDLDRFSQREAALWLAVLLFTGHFIGSVRGVVMQSVSVFSETSNIGVFHCLAWLAIFTLLFRSKGGTKARSRDFAALFGIALVALLPGGRMTWIAATAASAYLYWGEGADAHRKSAAAVLLALASQMLWAPRLFELFAYDLVRLDAIATTALLSLTDHAVLRHGNIIVMDKGGVAVFGGCSSFHNFSLAILCWVSVTKLARPFWRRSDLMILGLIAAATVAINCFRLCMMVVDQDNFSYWHFGAGAQMLTLAISAIVTMLSLYGAQRQPRLQQQHQ